MREGRIEERKQGVLPFTGGLEGESISARGDEPSEPWEGDRPSQEASSSAAARELGERERDQGALDPTRQVTSSAETLAQWKTEAEDTLRLMKVEMTRLEAASSEFQEGGWRAVTSISTEEKAGLIEQVDRTLAAGGLPIPEFVPSYLSSNIKRLEKRVAELGTLRPADGGEEPEAPREEGENSGEESVPNAYEQKLEARKERLEDAAARARERSAQQYQRANELTEHIPLGQPILRRHHSEKRHRTAIKRTHQAMDRSVEEASEAKELEIRAKRVGTGGVSADDPAAVQKLQAKLKKMEERREFMKRVNKEFRQGGWDAVTGISDAARERFHSMMLEEPWKGGRPFQAYELTNLGTNIRRVKGRIEALSEAQELEPGEAVEGGGYRLEDDRQTNRMRFFFDSKPSEEVLSILKANGFRWAPSVKAWQRQASANGRVAAERVRRLLEQPRD